MSQKSNKRNRAPNFTYEERNLLVSQVSEYRCILENKKTDNVTCKEKEKTWMKLTEEFNSYMGTYRTVENLKYGWENMKRKFRKANGNQKDVFKSDESDQFLKKVRKILTSAQDDSHTRSEWPEEYVYEIDGIVEENGEDALGSMKIFVVEDPSQIAEIKQQLEGSRKDISENQSVSAEQCAQTPKTPLRSTTLSQESLLNETSDSLPTSAACIPYSTASVPPPEDGATVRPSTHNYARKNRRVHPATWRHRRRPVVVPQGSTTAGKLAQAKLEIAMVTKKQTEDEGRMRKEMWALRLKHKKVLLEISELELKRKRKLFEREFGKL